MDNVVIDHGTGEEAGKLYRDEIRQLQTELEEHQTANKRLRDALQKIQNAKIANMKPNSVALYQMFVKETAEQALKEVADFEQRPEARNLYGVRAVIEQLQAEKESKH